MNTNEIYRNLKQFYLPEWIEIPDVGLYLDQVVKFVNHYLQPYPGMAVTGSMVSNYVKLGVIGKAQKKAYSRDLIAHILFVAVARTVLTLDQLKDVRKIITDSGDMKRWYEAFCLDMKECLEGLSNGKTIHLEETGEARQLIHNIAVAVAHKMYLDQFFDMRAADSDTKKQQ